MEESKTQAQAQNTQNDSEKPKLVDVNVSDENTALNVIFL